MFIGSPGLLALLGLATFHGLRSRARSDETLNKDHDQSRSPGPWTESRFDGGSFGGGFGGVFPGGIGGGFVVDLSNFFGGQPRGAVVSGGLSDLIRQLEAAGYGQAAESWVSDRPNQPVRPDEVERVLDEDLLHELEQRTGLPRAEILERLATALPETVNQLTPQGRVPTEAEAEQLLTGSAGSDVLPAASHDAVRPDTKAEPFVIGPDIVELKEPRT